MSLAEAPSVREALRSGGPFTEVVHLERVASTNDVARRRLADGTAAGLVVVADRQTAGRGRAGRRWTDDLDGPEGPANLAVTATVSTPEVGAGLLPLAAGLAVAAAFEAAGAVAELKWPNDVLLGQRKACGILVERHRTPHGDHVLIGCGLDLDWRGVRREGDARSWTSLAEVIDGPVDRGQVLGWLLAALGEQVEAVVHHPERLMAAYRARCATLGRPVRAELPGAGTVEGTAEDLDEDGRLIVRTADGPVTVVAGDVRHVRADP